MGKEPLALEWTIEEDDGVNNAHSDGVNNARSDGVNNARSERAWQTIQPVTGITSSTPGCSQTRQQHAYTGELRLAALIAAICVFMAAGWVWHTRQVARQMGEGVTIVAHQDRVVRGPKRLAWAPPHLAEAADHALQPLYALEFEELHQTIQDEDTAGQITLSIQVMSFRDQLALVEVVTQDASGGQGYRQVRAYQRAQGQWLPAVSADAAWGSWQTMETEHFSIRYRPVDTIAVTEAAPRLDRLYDRLSHDFGLPATVVTPKAVIEVVTDDLPEGYGSSLVKRTIMVPSPAMLFVPVEMTDATILYQSVVYPLARLVLMEVIDSHPDGWRSGMIQWPPIVNALRLWALWEDGGPLAVEHEDMVRRLYQNTQAATLGGRKALPAGYEQLCRAYSVWRLEPWHTSIPLTCRDMDEGQGSPWVYSTMPTRFDGWLTHPAGEDGYSTAPVGGTVALATVVDYVVATYGRDHLPRFVAALGKHASWKSMIPAVFGVSVAEFETGWRTYLEKQYGSETK